MKRRARSTAPWFTIAIVFAVVFLFFQNFSSLPLSALNPRLSTAEARAVSPSDGTGDIRRLAPTRPELPDDSMIAVPQSGADLNSISQDWMTRQTHLITGGAEQKILDGVNRRMNRWISSAGTDENESAARKAGVSAAAAGSLIGDSQKSNGLLSFIQPRGIRFSHLNQMDLDFENDARLSCVVRGDTVQWELSKSVIGNVDINIRHSPRDSANSLHLKYGW